ncbi:hypothetical protein SLEP1_g9272 [Rubroshorea leprosula]|uniref:Uncharacterized protein n=1 Tax=Rubroshorea leprosula TaxID=152421 RepID=A0AAV5ICT4_9ROSI|nr:hypothetical protein SLEP1_g9272 [Rubroshorea leprosula]
MFYATPFVIWIDDNIQEAFTARIDESLSPLPLDSVVIDERDTRSEH